MGSWPSIALETREWVSKFSTDQLTRAQSQIFRGPYEAAVVPSIAQLEPQIDGALAAEIEDASTALVRFDSQLGSLSMPFAAILLRSESASSSQIEQLTSGARAIAEAELGERETGNGALIVRNVRALQAALELADSIDAAAIIAMQHALLGAHAPHLTGAFRDEQVWIGGSAAGPHTAAFVAPHHERVPAAIDDLLAFVHRNDIPVLSQVAIAHAHFETIHPFPDGNGRTGRALVQAMMRQKGLTANVTVPVSAGLLQDVDSYYAALTSYRAGDIRPIITAFADASFRAITNGRILTAKITEARDTWNERMRPLRIDAAARRVAALALEQPVLNQRMIGERLHVSAMTAYRALEALESRGILRAASSAKRNRIWIADDIIDALDAFASRAGRRVR